MTDLEQAHMAGFVVVPRGVVPGEANDGIGVIGSVLCAAFRGCTQVGAQKHYLEGEPSCVGASV